MGAVTLTLGAGTGTQILNSYYMHDVYLKYVVVIKASDIKQVQAVNVSMY